MTIRIKITPDPEDVAEMRNQLAKQPGVDDEKLKLFDQFFTEFDAKLAIVDFNNSRYGLYDVTDFNLFIDRVRHRKELMDWKYNTEHYLDPARYITIECNLISEEHNKMMLNAFKRKKNQMAEEKEQLNFENYLLEMVRLGFLGRKTFKKLRFQSISGKYENITISEMQFKILPNFFSFNKTMFLGVTFKNCVFQNVGFSKAELVRVKFTGCKFYNCDFSQSNFKECFFDKSNFINCAFQETKLDENKILNSGFECSFFISSKITKCEFINSSLKAADLHKASIDGCLINNTSLCGADISEMIATNSDFVNADFKNCDDENARFVYCSFKSKTENHDKNIENAFFEFYPINYKKGMDV